MPGIVREREGKRQVIKAALWGPRKCLGRAGTAFLKRRLRLSIEQKRGRGFQAWGPARAQVPGDQEQHRMWAGERGDEAAGGGGSQALSPGCGADDCVLLNGAPNARRTSVPRTDVSRIVTRYETSPLP